MSQDWTPTTALSKAVVAAGFLYDPEQGIIYSRMDALQRSFGYCYFYDFVAPGAISAVIDCEPFFFTYGGKDWMIELWKGQYGIETGGEIGVYNRKSQLSGAEKAKCDFLDGTLGKRPGDPANSKFFACASNDDRLVMSFTLSRDGQELFKRGPEAHWWLTGFKWGVLSRPEQLTMDLSITFPDDGMRRAFVGALANTKYEQAAGSTGPVKLTFSTPPASPQPRDTKAAAPIASAAWALDTQIVKEYQALGLRSSDPNLIPGELARKIADYFSSMHALGYGAGLTKTLRADGVGAPDVGRILRDALGLAAPDVASILKGAGYGFRDIGAALKAVFGYSATQVAKALRAIGATYPQVAKVLKGVFRLGLAETGKALVAAGAGYKQVEEALEAAFQPTKAELLRVLKSLF